MKVGWETSTLGDVLAVLRNGVNCKQDKSGTGDKISRIESISDGNFNTQRVGYAHLTKHDKERYALKRGDILFSHINSVVHVGKTAVFDCAEPVYHGVNLLLMRPTPAVTSAYLEYALKFLFQSGYWRHVCKQSVNQASVNQQDIARVEIRYPKSLSEQRLIVALLDEAFAAIAIARSNTEMNLENAQWVFESALEDVFVLRAKGWVHNRIVDVCEIKPPKAEARLRLPTDSLVSFLPMEDLATDEKQVCAKKTRVLGDVQGSYTYFANGDILLAKITPCFENGKLGIASDLTNGVGFGSSEYMVFRPRDAMTPDWLYYFMSRISFRRQGVGQMFGAVGHKRVSREFIENLQIPCPTLREQFQITTKLDSLRSETKQLTNVYQQKLATLLALKKSLLQQAFTDNM